jgi:hypothetical protein
MEKSGPDGMKRKLTGEGAGQHTRGAYAYAPGNDPAAQVDPRAPGDGVLENGQSEAL